MLFFVRLVAMWWWVVCGADVKWTVCVEGRHWEIIDSIKFFLREHFVWLVCSYMIMEKLGHKWHYQSKIFHKNKVSDFLVLDGHGWAGNIILPFCFVFVSVELWNNWLDSIAVSLFTNSETAAMTLWERLQNFQRALNQRRDGWTGCFFIN